MITLERERYYGTEVAKRRFGGVTLAETAYAPGMVVPPHRHENAYVCLVLSGGYRERTRLGDRQCGARTLLYHRRESIHSDEFGATRSRCFNVEFASEEPIPTPVGRGLVHRLYHEFREPDAYSPAVVAALTAELVTAAATEPGGRWLDQVRAALHDAMGTLPPLEELARLAGVHPTHLARAFRKAFGCTAGEYARKLKVEQTLIDVTHTERPFSEIAQRHGFADQAHFTRSFKRVTGATPGAWRRRR